MNGGLGITAPSEFGTCGLMIASPAAPVAGYGVAFLVKSKAEAKTAFAQGANAAVLAAIETFFYGEAPESTKLYILCLADTTTLTQMATVANMDKLSALAGNQIRLVAFAKIPAGGYTPTNAEGFDQDVHQCVTAAHAVALDYLGKKKSFRYFVQGYGYQNDHATAKDYSSAAYSFGHIVLGAIGTNTLNPLLLCLGRAAKIQPQQNIGRVKSGSLNIDQALSVTIGNTVVDNMSATALEALYDKRYITFEKNLIAAGYIFSDDNSLTAPTDDYNNLRNGRVMDNAVRTAFATYYKELKEDVEVDAGGRLAPVVEKALEAEIESAINQGMASQLSK
ncbi:MAG: hypothetical protein EOO14_20075, partial [Chitinophagaceae bacterium]